MTDSQHALWLCSWQLLELQQRWANFFLNVSILTHSEHIRGVLHSFLPAPTSNYAEHLISFLFTFICDLIWWLWTQRVWLFRDIYHCMNNAFAWVALIVSRVNLIETLVCVCVMLNGCSNLGIFWIMWSSIWSS